MIGNVMHSIRTKIALFNTIAISISIAVATVIAAVTIASYGHQNTMTEMSLLCKTGKSNINYYLQSVEQSVNTISHLIDKGLDSIDEDNFNEEFINHVENARNAFSEAALNTNGVLTYYYRIDPSISDITGEKGFWYTNLDGKGPVEHEVTDLSDDQNECVWFYTPKKTGRPIWLPPYVTDGLDVFVISYNVPVYRGTKKQFVGVVGIEISYTTLGKQINNIKVLDSGYAYIVENEKGSIIYHPTLDILSMKPEDRPTIPPEFLKDFFSDTHAIKYTFQGISKEGYWLSLSNNMSVVVCAPSIEVNRTWVVMVLVIIGAGVVLASIFAVIAIQTSKHITQPLNELTKAAEEIDNGNYDIKADYNGDDEIGILTGTFNKLVNNLRGYINDLNNLAYADALTNVSNISAFNVKLEELEKELLETSGKMEFAIAILDCDNLKDINDEFGHDKGDLYLRNSSHLMCRVFANSVIYRIGGDEFAIILEGEDYTKRRELEKRFVDQSKEICALSKHPWEQIKVSIGIADYDRGVDKSAKDVMIHADHIMYSFKRLRKAKK